MPEAAIGPGDTVAILYTSGTTGVSKGVCCPHAQYFWWGVNTARLLGLRGDDVLLTTLPLFHTNALNTFYQALLTGAALVVEPRFSASGFAASLCPPWRQRHLPSRRDGADPALPPAQRA